MIIIPICRHIRKEGYLVNKRTSVKSDTSMVSNKKGSIDGYTVFIVW